MKIINLTTHDVNVLEGDCIRVYRPSGQKARVNVKTEVPFYINGAPVERHIYDDITGVPEPQEDTLYIVSTTVRLSLPNRRDLISPDTRRSAIRKSNGEIDYVIGWLCN
jgi:hypothetical protein